MKTIGIVGSGITGLSLALKLSELKHKIVLFDPDFANIGTNNRKYCPQNKHLHVLLQEGQNTLFKLFPQIEKNFNSLCPRIDWAEQTRWTTYLGTFPRYEANLKTYSFSKFFLESQLLKLLNDKENITIKKLKVRKLVKNSLNKGHTISAEFSNTHVDELFICAGANFPITTFLGKNIKETRKVINIFYQSKLTPHSTTQEQTYYQFFPAIEDRGSVQTPIENNNLIKTDIYFNTRPLTGLNIYGKRYSYRRTPILPTGVYILGDALCSLNPVFGQGMTVALKQVEYIFETYQFEKAIQQKKLNRLNLRAWMLSNLAFPQKKGPLLNLLKMIYKRCLADSRNHYIFLNVLHLKISPLALLRIFLPARGFIK